MSDFGSQAQNARHMRINMCVCACTYVLASLSTSVVMMKIVLLAIWMNEAISRGKLVSGSFPSVSNTEKAGVFLPSAGRNGDFQLRRKPFNLMNLTTLSAACCPCWCFCCVLPGPSICLHPFPPLPTSITFCQNSPRFLSFSPSHLSPRLKILFRALFGAFSGFPLVSRNRALRASAAARTGAAGKPVVTVDGLPGNPPPEDSDFPMDRGADRDSTKGATMSLLAFLGVCQSAGLVATTARVALMFGGNARGGELVDDVLGSRRRGRRSGRGRGGGGGFGILGGTGGARKLDATAEATTTPPDASFPVSFIAFFLVRRKIPWTVTSGVLSICDKGIANTGCAVCDCEYSTSECCQCYRKTLLVESSRFAAALV